MKRFILLLFLAIFELSYSQDAIFKPFRKLYTIQTEKFEIIFPIESRRTAEKLSEFADEIYEECGNACSNLGKGLEKQKDFCFRQDKGNPDQRRFAFQFQQNGKRIVCGSYRRAGADKES